MSQIQRHWGSKQIKVDDVSRRASLAVYLLTLHTSAIITIMGYVEAEFAQISNNIKLEPCLRSSAWAFQAHVRCHYLTPLNRLVQYISCHEMLS